ncbi:hypothetical protein DJ533_12570 [Acinetobacter defluvii]|uniref:Uncharacterized protein n=1 Tax=Acinetobacter defluvii TaxID=1871111 RepID=A0A2S2FEH5_9GAMM|nr:hypothetical protein [Acinetobacter defluvii]AWL29344.1 hypothetical protein DJ533_12570 [Acinetobacter defluvii]
MHKQTQTKLFDFSDVGLDFCAGSKNLFPDRFKKMLAQGYNEKTANSVTISGSTITLTFGVTHGYVADRVLQVTAAGGFNKEVYIDSVTENAVTCTVLDGVTSGLTGTVTTKIASLGWEIVYEQAHIHIYKFKHIDDTDMYARLCFQNATAAGNRNCIAVGIGRTVDLALGHITDPNCMPDLATCATVADATSNLRWDFTNSTAATFNNYTYSQGFSTFGQGKIVGSPYHLIAMYRLSSGSGLNAFCGVVPFISSYENINYPALLCSNNGAATTAASYQIGAGRILVGKILCGTAYTSSNGTIYPTNTMASSFLSNKVDGFNTTTCEPYRLYEDETNQFLGCFAGGIFHVLYGSSDRPNIQNESESPTLTLDIDFKNLVFIQGISSGGSSSIPRHYIAVPVEEIKIGY